MARTLKKYERIFYIGIIVIAIGIVMTTNRSDSLGNLGVVFIGIGGLLFISAMKRKRDEEVGRSD